MKVCAGVGARALAPSTTGQAMAGENKTASDGKGAKTIEGAAEEVKKKKPTSPIKFAREVRDEASKVTWTSRQETFISTIMVLIMVFIMAIFFFVVDQGLRFGVCSILRCATT
jgi:preprotein translocase subunit SecE